MLGLVRGGVAIGRVLGDELRLPLFPYVVRKIGHPSHREFGVGAIAEGGATYFDRETMRMYGLTDGELEAIIEEERAELERRRKAYAITLRPSLQGKTVILTDDGAATGGTMFAAVEDVRRQGVAKVVVALPVSPPDTVEALRRVADAVVILATPEPFNAVGQWYVSFPQLTDEDVLIFLQEGRGSGPLAGANGDG